MPEASGIHWVYRVYVQQGQVTAYTTYNVQPGGTARKVGAGPALLTTEHGKNIRGLCEFIGALPWLMIIAISRFIQLWP